MAKRHVQVVLKAHVDSLGQSGELVRVRPGFARNFLIPKGVAVIASRENVRAIEHEKLVAKQRLDKLRAEAVERSKAFDGLKLHVAKQVADADSGKLFGSVTVSDVSDALEARGFTNVDKKSILLPEDHIKATGSYEIQIHVGSGVKATVKLEVKTAS